MPASRSRTERWRECLQHIYERNGGLEISLARGGGEPAAPDLLWRVRILSLGDDFIMVEKPAAAGRGLEMSAGASLLAVMAVGQNRWMFHTRILGEGAGSPGASLRLAMPESVTRCQRRDFLRIPTASLRLPRVQCWRVLDPSSVSAAEVANRALILDLERGAGPGDSGDDTEAWVLPTVGPGFSAHLMNIGGGGVGLLVEKGEASAAEHCRHLWMKIDLRPSVPAPLGMAARVAHVHLDHEQRLYVGVAFEFATPAHREFVISQIVRCLGAAARGRAA